MAKRSQYVHGALRGQGKHLTPWQQREAMRGVAVLRAPRPHQDRLLAQIITREAAAQAKARS